MLTAAKRATMTATAQLYVGRRRSGLLISGKSYRVSAIGCTSSAIPRNMEVPRLLPPCVRPANCRWPAELAGEHFLPTPICCSQRLLVSGIKECSAHEPRCQELGLPQRNRSTRQTVDWLA